MYDIKDMYTLVGATAKDEAQQAKLYKSLGQKYLKLEKSRGGISYKLSKSFILGKNGFEELIIVFFLFFPSKSLSRRLYLFNCYNKEDSCHLSLDSISLTKTS